MTQVEATVPDSADDTQETQPSCFHMAQNGFVVNADEVTKSSFVFHTQIEVSIKMY